MSSGNSIVVCMVARPSCQLSQEQLSSAARASASSTGSCARLGMLRYRGLARRVPALRRGHAIVLPSGGSGSRARQTFATPGRPSRRTESSPGPTRREHRWPEPGSASWFPGTCGPSSAARPVHRIWGGPSPKPVKADLIFQRRLPDIAIHSKAALVSTSENTLLSAAE
jgi:hypothetical protein